MPLTFVHCSDLHLGRERLGSKLPQGDLAAALQYIVDFTIRQEADGLLLAGDLFDTPNIQPQHLGNAITCLTPLKERGIPVFAIEGNHDRPSLSAEAPTWVRYLNDQGYLQLLSIPFTPAGPVITEWDPASRRGSYLMYHGVRIIGAGYLGAGTIRRMQAIAAYLQDMDSECPGQRPPTILLLHAGPEYLVHEGGGFDRDSLDFLRPFVDYLALGHIHKPMILNNWAVNPGTAENIRLEEASYGLSGHGDARGLALLRLDLAGLFPQIAVEILPVPRRPVQLLRQDCSGLTGSRAGEQLKTALLATARNAGVTPQTVIRVELSGELNLQRAGIDLAELAGFLEKELPVCAAELSMGTSDLSVGIGSGLELPGTGETREAIERQAIMDILAAGPPEFVEPQQLPDLTELFMQLKEAVRREEPAEEIVDRLARHSVVQELARKYTAIREAAAAPGNAAEAVGKESSNDCTPDQAKEY